MQIEDSYERISQHPDYARLVGKRRQLVVGLSALVVGVYSVFIVLLLSRPVLLLRPLSDESLMNVGAWFGVLIIVGSWLLMGLYVWRANGEFDRLTHNILKEGRP